MSEFIYRRVVENVPAEDGGGYVAYYPTLGRYAMNGVGDTIREALSSLDESREAVLEFMSEKGIELPPPTPTDLAVKIEKEAEAARNRYAFAA